MEKSFDPILGVQPKVLILGSLPGKESLRIQQYYGNVRNAFWKILFSLFDEELEGNYTAKKEFLIKNKIALWDVCRLAERKSSLDSDIKNELPNSIENLIKSNPSIKIIGFNGRKTEQLYDKYFNRFEEVSYYTLLSTSPANARYSFEEKLNNWKSILK
ncbi:G/U mismatch-specific uracil-DNA glycosylase [Tenacibaculum adriaticum]|uniref:G/U mismatch-specific uracil-DNA glycosylase n=1 Tax=Tenacibaculum adriaticum TaxID=413713 RepID=A0A5S5DQC6_9FLAO|nr:DNA-deoxyinosine glycosylase [Tenacibaculum adriaticum]TYP97935.1 G/U mismatch-specific uracil-DNA glycosylase [Tenacibaculum adriaticum]